jgi:hypothetical protein
MIADWLTTSEAAATLEVREQTIRSWLSNPTMRAKLELRRIGPDTRGGQWLISAASVARIQAERAANPPRAGRPRTDTPSPMAVAKRRSRARHTKEST